MLKKFVLFSLAVMMMIFGTAFAEGTYRIEAPDGAPALTVSALKDNVQTVDAGAIAASFSSEEADFIIAPVNAGAKLFKAGKSTYRLTAVVTWGNLVFASQIPDFSLETMNEREVVLFGENTINASVALYILNEKGIHPGEISYLAAAKNTQELLLNDPESIVMTAEPAATVAKMKNENIQTISLADLYKEISNDDGYVQAGLFVREKTIEEHPEEVNEWIAEIKASADRCTDDPEATAKDAVEMGIMPNEKIVLNSIQNCNIRFVGAKDARDMIEKTISIDPSQYGGEVPADEFYYDAE